LKTHSEVNVRTASSNDASEVHALILELAEFTDDGKKVSSTIENIRAALSGGEPLLNAFIAEQDGNSVGVAIVYLTFSTWRGTKGVYLQDIYVRPDLRSTGTGRQLLSAVATWAAAQGADHLRLSVDADNLTAQSFYGHAGMLHRDDEMTFQISGASFEKMGKQE